MSTPPRGRCACGNPDCNAGPAFGTREWFRASPFSWDGEDDYQRTDDGPEGDGWRYEYVSRSFGTCTERRLVLHVDAAGEITDETFDRELPALIAARLAERRRCAELARGYDGPEGDALSISTEIARRIEAEPKADA